MKLASLKAGRDGRLVVVSNDLAWFIGAEEVAPTLQAALDDWDRCEPPLRGLAASLEHGSVPRERFHEHDAASPLPRAYQWADGSAYVNHVALVRQARAAEMPESFWTDPLMYQGGSDGFLGPRDPIPLADESWGCDLEAEVAVVTGDVPMGVTRDEVAQADVVDQHDEPDRGARLLRRRAHRNVASHYRDLALEVDAPGLVGQRDRVARSEEGIRPALIHQRVGPEALRHLGAARLAHQLDVVDVGRTVDPLVGARQRRHAAGGVEVEMAARAAVVQAVGQFGQLRRDKAPVVERRLQRRRDAVGHVR